MTSEKKNTLLVPTDFSNVAENALNHAINVANVFGNKLCIMHIFEDSVIGSIWGAKNSYRDGMVGQMLNERLETLCNKIKEEHGVEASYRVETGRIYSTIVDFAEDDANDIESIVMGTNGASGMAQVIGSNASRVISSATVPVVVVKERQYDNGYRNIIMPIDLTMESKQKVKWAIHLAKRYDSIIHIFSIEEKDEFLQKRIGANLKQVQEVLEKNNVKYDTKVLDDRNYPGNPAEDTLQYANEIDADLILIMSQQERGIGEYIIGTYAQQIVNNHSATPVMCVNPVKTGLKADYWHGI